MTTAGAPTTTAARRNPDPYRHLEARLVRLSGLGADDDARAPLRNELMLAFAPVCRNVACRFVGRGESVEDLEQVAAIGLLKALDHFRLPPGYDPVTAFMGYAVPTVSGELLRHLRDHTWVVHVPRPVKEIQGRLWSAVAELGRQYGRPPHPGELAAYLQVGEALVIESLQAGTARRPTSADAPVDDFGGSLIDEMAAVDTGPGDIEVHDQLRAALRQLPQRSVQIVAMRFFDDLTQLQIARQLGISQMHVSRLLSRSLATLRADMAATSAGPDTDRRSCGRVGVPVRSGRVGSVPDATPPAVVHCGHRSRRFGSWTPGDSAA